MQEEGRYENSSRDLKNELKEGLFLAVQVHVSGENYL